MTTTRRHFILATAAGAASCVAAMDAQAQAMLTENDPQALALGYVADAARVDVRKYPKYVRGQACAGCALYQGKPDGAMGNCPLYAGKQVSAKGWCSAWARKA